MAQDRTRKHEFDAVSPMGHALKAPSEYLGSQAATEHPETVLFRRIENDFAYHQPTPDMIPKFRILRGRFRELAHLIQELVPEGRERCIALTRLEESMMLSNAGIARKGPVSQHG